MNLKWLSGPPHGPWEFLGQALTGLVFGLAGIAAIIGLAYVLG